MAGGDVAPVNVDAWPPGGVPASIRLVRVHVPLKSVHRAAHGAERMRDVILVCWTRPDGVQGWGECPTLSGSGYATETTDAAWAGLTSRMVPAVLEGSAAILPGLVAASGALLDAALDAELRATGRGLAATLAEGATTRTRLERCVVLADLGASPESLAARSVEAVSAGASMVKVKIAPGHDVAVLRAVQDAVGEVPVAADANGSYADLAAIAAVDELGLAYLEQPAPAGTTWDDLAAWSDALVTPVALDESLVSLDAVQSAVRAGAADVISVKPARLGGVRLAATAVALAADSGVDVFVGGMLELGIGRAAAVAVAAQAGCSLPTDLGPSEAYVDDEICEPIVADASGRLVVPDGPGSGRVPDEELLLRRRVDEVTLGA